MKRCLGLAMVLRGDGRGLVLLQEALASAEEMDMRLEVGRVLIALATADTTRRRRCLHEAREIFASSGSQRGLAEVREAASVLGSA